MISDTRSWGCRLGFVVVVTILGFSCARASDAPSRSWTLGHFQHTAWTEKDGAPSGISCLAQTTDGYLWMGSETGLYRFDGNKFVTFAPATGEHLLSDAVQALLAEPSGGLWIGYVGDGISYLKNGHLTHYGADSGFPAGNIYSIVRDKYSDIWAESLTGLMRFHDGAWRRFGEESGLPNGRPAALLVDSNGRLWLTQVRRIFSFDHTTSRFEDAGVALPEGPMFLMRQAPDGSFLLSVSTKLILHFVVSDRHLIPDGALPFDSAGITFDGDGGMWVATLGNGLYRFADAHHALQSATSGDMTTAQHFSKIDGLSADYVWPALVDHEGNIWFGTQRGLDSFRPSTFSAVALPDGIHDVAIARGANGSMWVGSSNQPVLHITDTGYVATAVPPYALAMQQGSTDGSVLAGLRGRVWQLDAAGNAKELAQPKAFQRRMIGAVLRDRTGRLWLSSLVKKAGLLQSDGEDWNLVAHVIDAWALFEDSNGTVWVGGRSTPQLIAFFNNTSKTYGAVDGLDIGMVRVLSEHGHRLWAVGERGISYLQDGRFVQVHLDGGTPLRNVTGLLFPEDGSMWVHSLLGILRISPDELARAEKDAGHAMKYQLFDENDGIPGTASQEVPLPSAAEGSDGRLWFASASNLVWLDPHHVVHNDIPPPVAIESIYVNGKRVNTSGPLTISSATKTIDIAYSAPSLVAPHKVRFRYRLDGFDTSWSESKSTRQVSYANIPPGTYSFHVIASNNDGVWNMQGASIKFSIKPSLFQTWWFRLLCVLAGAVMLFFFLRWRIAAASTRLRDRLGVRDRERMRIAHDLHDTLLQTVQALLMQVNQAALAMPKSEPAQAMLKESVGIAKLALAEGRDRIVSLQSFSGEQQQDPSIALEVTGRHLEAIHQKSFSMRATGDCPKLPDSLGNELIDIAREAMLNAFRHSEGKSVAVTVAYGAREIRISVIDDGKGIDPAIFASGGVPGHWGLKTILDRASNIGASVVWSDGSPGTHFECRVPSSLTFRVILANPVIAWRRWQRRQP